MNFASVLLAPLALLLPAAGAVELPMSMDDMPADSLPPEPVEAHVWPVAEGAFALGAPGSGPWPAARIFVEGVRPQEAWQIRIEQRVQIRISPRIPMPVPPDMFERDPEPDILPHRPSERKIGNCVVIAGIAGVETDKANRLLLFMRDRRVIAAELDRSCRSRDFYSGFYLSRSPDGRLCVDRDTLLSRSGANCKLTRIRQLVEDADH